MSLWSTLWIAWGAAFAVIETVALTRDRQDTLSDHLRRWFHTDTHFGRSVWIFASGIFFGWFVVHIAVAGAA